jgi:hypothetical protein
MDVRPAASAEIFDCLTHGVVLLDASGRAVVINAAAQSAFSCGDALALEDGCLRALRESDNVRLQTLIEAALRTDTGSSGGSLALMRKSGKREYGLTTPPPCSGCGRAKPSSEPHRNHQRSKRSQMSSQERHTAGFSGGRRTDGGSTI